MPLHQSNLNRAELAVTGVLSFLLFVMLLFAVALFFGQSQARAAEGSERELTATLARARKPFTAEVGYVRAEALAKTWAPDARLAVAQTTIYDPAQFEADISPWSFIFYSTRDDATALFLAEPDSVTLVNTRPASAPVQALEAAVWKVDSAAAIAEFLARGGALFLNAYPQASLYLILGAADGPAWQARLIDNESGNTFQLNLDAATGALLLEPAR